MKIDKKFVPKEDAFIKWYNKIERWIKKNYRFSYNRGGYFGPHAWKLYKNGAELSYLRE